MAQLCTPTEIARYRQEISGMDDDALICELTTLCNDLHHSAHVSPSDAIVNLILRQRQRLREIYLECERRDLLEAYDKIFSTKTRKQRRPLLVTNKEHVEIIRRAHCEYTLPARKNMKDLIHAIDFYAQGSETLNRLLRTEPLKNINEGYLTRIRALGKAMQPVARDIHVVRGFSLPGHKPLTAGDIFHEKGFLGTTAKRSVAHSFKGRYFLELDVPEGTPYLSIWKGAVRNRNYVGHEQEILLGRGRRLFIEKATQKRGYILLNARVVTPAEAKELKDRFSFR